MAEVWSARNELTNRDFAIKILLPSLARREDAVERFVREAKATGQLHHPNLVSVFDAGRTQDGRPYLVMELLVGESLEDRLERVGKLPQLTTCLLLSKVAWALQAAHRAGVVHRDLSSANVFLIPTDERSVDNPKILDFGVSKFIGPVLDGRVRTEGGTVLGSPAYMSPEQAQGSESVDGRTDLWALGVLMYECLCGERPFAGNNYNALIYAINSSPHRSLRERAPEVHPELAKLVDGCLVKDQSVREYSARSVAARLEKLAWSLSSDGRDTRVVPRRRATDRLSLRPESLSGPRPALRSVGLAPNVLPAPVRWWLDFTRNGTPGQLIAVSSAMFGALIGITLGIMMATDGSHPQPMAAPRVPIAPAPTMVAQRDVLEAVPKPPEAMVAPVEKSQPPSAPAQDPEPSLDLAESVQRALEFQLKETKKPSDRPAVFLSKPAPR